MSTVSQMDLGPHVEVLDFVDFRNLGDPIAGLVRDLGVVYVTAITRNDCSGCTEQKPLFRDLAKRMNLELSGKVHFTNVHVQSLNGDTTESWESKKLLRHAAYPTYLVHVGSKNGPLEIYRAIYPSMVELEKQIRESLELAQFYKDES